MPSAATSEQIRSTTCCGESGSPNAATVRARPAGADDIALRAELAPELGDGAFGVVSRTVDPANGKGHGDHHDSLKYSGTPHNLIERRRKKELGFIWQGARATELMNYYRLRPEFKVRRNTASAAW